MPLNSFTPNTKIKSSEENANWNNFSAHGRNFTLKWTFSGNLYVVTSNDVLSLNDNGTLSRVDLVVAGAPSGSTIIVDIERSTDNGATWVTIFTGGGNRPTIANGAKTGNTTTIDVNGLTANSHLYRAKISQVGSTTSGNDLSVMLRGTYDLD